MANETPTLRDGTNTTLIPGTPAYVEYWREHAAEEEPTLPTDVVEALTEDAKLIASLGDTDASGHPLQMIPGTQPARTYTEMQIACTTRNS